MTLFKDKMREALTQKSEFVTKHIPYARYLSMKYQDKIAYALDQKSFFMDEKLVKVGDVADSLIWIISGQCQV